MKTVDLSNSTNLRRTRGVPTRYANVTFRSQLEARWALFLDKMDVSWKYEPQGFSIIGIDSNGKTFDAFAYLPDFKISYGGEGDDWWLEIKGRPPTPRELHKCECLALGTGQTVVLVCGGFWDTPQSRIYKGANAPPGDVDVLLRWLSGQPLTNDNVARVAEAYRSAGDAWFERAKKGPPRRRKRSLRQLTVRKPAPPTPN